MSEYYDKFGMLRPAKDKDGENDIVFIAYEDVYRDIGKERAHLILYLHVDKDGYIMQTPTDGRLASHDNITAFLYLASKYQFTFNLKVKQIIQKYWHPRDLLFLMGVKNNPFLLLNVFPNKKVTPNIFSRIWIKMTCEYEHTVNTSGGSQEYYRNKAGETVLIETSYERTDGKLLNLLRFKKNGSGIVSWLSDFAARRFFGDAYLFRWFFIYFNEDASHPAIMLSAIYPKVTYDN